MENLDDMKTMWLELNQRVKTLEEENRRLAHEAISNNLKTAQELLVRKYSRFIFVSLVMLIYIYLFVMFNQFVVEKFRIPTLIYWSLFFLFEAGIDCYLMLKVKEIDVFNSSITEISRQAKRNWKIHKIAICIGFPLAIGACILFGLLLNADKFVILGMITGGIVGLLIGIRQLMKFLKYYKQLQGQTE